MNPMAMPAMMPMTNTMMNPRMSMMPMMEAMPMGGHDADDDVQDDLHHDGEWHDMRDHIHGYGHERHDDAMLQADDDHDGQWHAHDDDVRRHGYVLHGVIPERCMQGESKLQASVWGLEVLIFVA